MVKHEVRGPDCRECLVCGNCHPYAMDYLVCEFTVLETTIVEVSDLDMEALSQFLYPSRKPDMGLADSPEA